MPGTLANISGLPGIEAAVESQEVTIWWGHENLRILDPSGVLVSTAVDASSTPTTTLKAGLIVGRITASGKWAHYAPAASDGTETAKGALLEDTQMLGPDSVVRDSQGTIMIGGLLRASKLNGIDAAARVEMANRFFFDDDI